MSALDSPVLSQRIVDPEMIAAAILHADLVPCQLGDRGGPSMVARVVCPEVRLDLLSIGPAMLFSGTMPPGCYTLIFVSDCPDLGRAFNFGVEHRDGYIGFFPPGGILDAYTPRGYGNVTLTVPAAFFEAAVERLFPDILEGILESGCGIRVGGPGLAGLRGLVAAVKSAIGDPESSLLSEVARGHLETELLDAFLLALRDGDQDIRCGVRIQRRWRRLRIARDYLAEHLDQPVQLTGLCGELGLSRRGVECIFRDTVGISPMAFLRQQRLCGARRALLADLPQPGAVKKVALDFGFWHMGHFASEYRKLFGESPSETLGRGL